MAGARRIKLLGLGVALLAILIAFPLWLVNLFVNKVTYGTIVPMIGFPLFLGGVIYAFGWVTEGFVRPFAKHRSSRLQPPVC